MNIKSKIHKYLEYLGTQRNHHTPSNSCTRKPHVTINEKMKQIYPFVDYHWPYPHPPTCVWVGWVFCYFRCLMSCFNRFCCRNCFLHHFHHSFHRRCHLPHPIRLVVVPAIPILPSRCVQCCSCCLLLFSWSWTTLAQVVDSKQMSC